MCADLDSNIKRAEKRASSRCRWRWREYSHHRLLKPMVWTLLNTGVEKRIRVWRVARPPALIESLRRLPPIAGLAHAGRPLFHKTGSNLSGTNPVCDGTPFLGSLLSDESLSHTGFLSFCLLFFTAMRRGRKITVEFGGDGVIISPTLGAAGPGSRSQRRPVNSRSSRLR